MKWPRWSRRSRCPIHRQSRSRLGALGKRLAAVLMVVMLISAPTAHAKPVFDCTDPDVRRHYPAQCPELGVPFLFGGDEGTSTGGGHCGVLCGILHGLGGLL